MKTISEWEALKLYDDFLDEVYGDVKITGYSYSTSNALKNCDEIAYREGFNNWLDSEDLEVE